MEPLEYLKILRRRWWVVALVVLVGVIAGFVTAPSESERVVSSTVSYRATTTFIVDPTQEVLPLSIDRAAFFTTTGIVPERVAEEIGFDGAGAQLASQVTATGDPRLGTLQISTTQPDAERAVEVAEAFAEALIAFLDEQGQDVFERQLSAEVQRSESLEAELAAFDREIGPDPDDPLDQERRRALIREIGLAEQRLSQLSSEGPARAGLVLLEEPAAIPLSTGGGFSPPEDRSSRVPLFGGFALVLAVGLALLVERFDTRIRSREAAETAYGLPMLDQLGLIPRSQRGDRHLLALSQPDAAMTEEYRSLRATLAFALADNAAEANVIAVTSAMPGEGKSTTVANLAAAFAEHGDRVVVINADFRRSTTNDLLDVYNGKGLGELLARNDDHAGTKIESLLRPSQIPGVRVLTQGRRNDQPATLLRNIDRVVNHARRHADVILVDTAPVLAAYDVAEIIPTVDLVAVLSRSGKVGHEAATRAGEIIRRAHPARVGIVLISAAGRTISAYGNYYAKKGAASPQPAHEALPAERPSSAPVRVGPG